MFGRGHMEKVKVLSLFNGISCGRVAFERAGIEVEKYVSYEVDDFANEVAKKNYPNDEYNGDVFKGDFTQYKGFDIVIGGSPCTYWSIAKRERETTSEGIGFELFKQFVRAVKESECKYFLYENNNSIHNDIKEEISRQLGVKPIMIDSRLVSAKGRKRCYWTNIPGVEQPEDKGILLQDILEAGGIAYAEKAYCLTSSYNGAVIWNSLERSQRTMVAERAEAEGPGVYKVEDGKVEIQSRKQNGEARNGVYKIKLPNGLYKFRKATPLEAERLQTLPDNYTSGVPTGQRYKQIGNGWTVDIIAHIVSYLLKIKAA